MLDKFYNFIWNLKDKDKIETVGDVLQIFIPLMTLIHFLFAGMFHESIVYVIAFLIAMGISEILKILFNNPRPRQVDTTDNPDLDLDWSPDEGNSFVSGHTMAAMTGALFWCSIDWFGAVIMILLACVVGFSRMAVKAHWLRDVLGSTVISILVYVISWYYFL